MLPWSMHGDYGKSSPHCLLPPGCCHGLWMVAMENDHSTICCHGLYMVAMENHHPTACGHGILMVCIVNHHPLPVAMVHVYGRFLWKMITPPYVAMVCTPSSKTQYSYIRLDITHATHRLAQGIASCV